MLHSSVETSPAMNPASVMEIALDIDPLALRVRIENEEHHFADRSEMESFLQSFWDSSLLI